MKQIEIVKNASKEVAFLEQTNFFTEGLTQDELKMIRGGSVDLRCRKGYYSGGGETYCDCGYKTNAE